MVQVLLYSDQYDAISDVSESENVGNTPFKSDVHMIIHFLHLKGVLGNYIHHRLCNVFGEGNVMAKYAIY